MPRFEAACSRKTVQNGDLQLIGVATEGKGHTPPRDLRGNPFHHRSGRENLTKMLPLTLPNPP